MKLVGITGGIGSGKSYVSSIFEHLDVPVYYADERAKNIMSENKQVVYAIMKVLGNSAYLEDGTLNKKIIARKIFSNSNLKEEIEKIVHTAVKMDFQKWVKQNKDEELLVKESALLIESGSYLEMDFVIVVTAPVDLRIKRVIERDKRTKEEVLKIINSQLSDKERIEYSDFVVNNSGEVLILPQIVEILKKITTHVI
jgi:dephospho-CoA kinase